MNECVHGPETPVSQSHTGYATDSSFINGVCPLATHPIVTEAGTRKVLSQTDSQQHDSERRGAGQGAQ